MNPYCYSAMCSWHGPISAVGKTKPTPPRTAFVGKTPIDVGGVSLPCCPFCGSMLFQVNSELEWQTGAKNHEALGHTHYVSFLDWTRTQSRCWPSLRVAALDFEKETGKKVVWDL